VTDLDQSNSPSRVQTIAVTTTTASPAVVNASQPPAATPVVTPSTTMDTWHDKVRLTRRQLVIAGAVLFILIVSGTAFAMMSRHHKPVQTAIATPRPTPLPTPVPTPIEVVDPVTGNMVTPAVAAQPVAGVMIENFYPDARPQSGLSQAGIVYEALAEGGITRFLAIFQEPFPGVMGPVRSLRPYYLDWGLERGIPVAHAGGSQPALAEIVPLGLKNINALEYDGSYFYRISTRYAPHNLYTNSDLLTKVVSKLGFAQAPTFQPLPRKGDTPAANPPATDIKIPFSYTAYNAEYKYNAAGNDYFRFEGGAPQVDAGNGGKQIQVKNLAVEFIPVTYGTQNDGDPDTDYHLIGSGKLLVFEDGNVITGTWSKASDSAPTQLLDQTGKPISFDRGSIWFNAVPASANVTY
jgi:hypothetical protein